jgi:dye decolorizing peroxidase
MTDHSRRIFLASGAGIAAGAIAGTFAGANLALGQQVKPDLLAERNSFFGEHQNGIELEQQAQSAFVAFDLLEDTTSADCLRWMSIITEDSSRLTQGKPALADPQPELVVGSAGLTVTVGFGPSLFAKLDLEAKRPSSLADLPAFKMDQLRPEFSGGDVLIQIAAHDPLVLAHAVRQLTRVSASFASVRWLQQGFLGNKDQTLPIPRSRNMMGQVEGSGNPQLGSEDFARTVWVSEGPNWIQGGTLLVIRRISMDLNGWDKLGRSAKEAVIGRTLDTSAPLGQTAESAQLNLSDSAVASAIPQDAHIRRASSPTAGQRIFRRSFNFASELNSDGTQEVGLIWTAYQTDIDKQYLPLQKRLESMDSLNSWTTPIGSAVFALARGVRPGEIIARELFG